jgi:hypothetical protein
MSNAVSIETLTHAVVHMGQILTHRCAAIPKLAVATVAAMAVL